MAKTETDDWEAVVKPFPTTIQFPPNGTFIGTYQRCDVIDLTDEATGELRPTNLYVFTQDGEDDEYSLWGSFNLDKAFGQIKPGTVCRITKGKKVENFKGSKSVQEWTVEVKR